MCWICKDTIPDYEFKKHHYFRLRQKGQDMNRFFILLIIVVGLAFIYKYLLNQSREPTGRVGNVMMKLWNKVYLPMAKWCLSFLPAKQFWVVVTLREINGVNQIDDFFQQCNFRGWLVNRINVKNRLDISQTADEEVKFK